MRFAFNILHDQPYDVLAQWWQMCDRAGAEFIGLPDSPLLLRELYVSATVCAQATESSHIMPAVTNPLTRDPAVVASALWSLDCLAPGRIRFGIGTGDSAAWAAGLRPATRSRLRDHIEAVRSLLRGEEATYGERQFSVNWAGWDGAIEIPVNIACSGPKVLQLAGEIADGVIVQVGCSPEDIAYVYEQIEIGCDRAGRRLQDVDVWWNAGVFFADSREEAFASHLGINPSWMTMGSLEGKRIPDQFKEPLLQLNADMHNLTNEYVRSDRGTELVNRAKTLGIYDWLMSRSPRLIGTPEDIQERLRELASMGATNWLFYVPGMGTEKEGTIRSLCDDVMPGLVEKSAS